MIIVLTVASILLRASLLKVNESILRKTNQPIVENIPLQADENSTVMEILQGNDHSAIRNLIINPQDDQLKKNLRFLNIEGTGMHNLEIRRRTNKVFIYNLLRVHQDIPKAMAWLKNNIEFIKIIKR